MAEELARGIFPEVPDRMCRTKRHNPHAALRVPWHLLDFLGASRKVCEIRAARTSQLGRLSARYRGDHHVTLGLLE